ncbi:MAG: membrane protein insertion efficiency factor YidD [Planctomycetota bacterium]
MSRTAKMGIALGLMVGALGASDEAPWSVDDRHPVFEECSINPQREPSAWLEFYQTWISSFDGSRCILHPTCSRYAAECFHQHGWLWGFVLTSERLMHEAERPESWRLMRLGDVWRYRDPVPTP